MKWLVRVLCLVALGVVGWALVTAWPAIRFGHPAYAVLLGLTVAGAVFFGARTFRAQDPRRGWSLMFAVLGVLFGVIWIAAIWWLRPFSAVEPALAAMGSDDAVTVTQTPTTIVMRPAGDPSPTALLFQPGAKVEARAYAAVLRPIAEAGHIVVIPKQPLGIAFLATGALAAAREEFPDVRQWVVAGHSLGGTVSAMTADAQDGAQDAPVTGLLLFASYPSTDISQSLDASVLSISGTNDGLATVADIEASRANLPDGSDFQAIEGAIHSFFGDYGPQPGDGQPDVSHDQARAQISELAAEFLSQQQ